MSRRSLLAVALVAALAVACGVPIDSEPRPLPPDRVPFGLLDPSSSTSTAVPVPPGSGP